MSTPGKEDSAFSPPRSEDEHMYDTMGSPTFETVPGVDGDMRHDTSPQDPAERERELKELSEELTKVENEIITLRQVLGSKVRRASELKKRMGITPLQEFKQDLQYGIKSIKESDTVVKTNEKLTNVKERITSSNAYQKTNEKLVEMNDKITHSSAYQKTSSAVKTASEKTNAVVSSFSASVSKKLGDIRNSNTFKSMEEKVGGAYSNVKTSRSIENIKGRLAKVTGSKSEGSFEEALQSEKAKEAGANGTTAMPDPQPIPEEKVPL